MMIRMKKHTLLPLAFMAVAVTGMAVPAQEALTESVTEAAVPDTEDETASWNVFFVKDPEQYVTLGEYRGLEVEKSVYTVSDEDVDIELDNRLYATATLEDTGRPAETGDTVTADITSTVGGKTTKDEKFPIDLGYEQFGPDFDAKLEGCSVGDQLLFTLSFDEDFEVEEWAGQTVDFQVDVTAVQTLSQPEFNDEWVKENSEYEDTESYRDALREQIQEDADRQNEETAASSAFSLAMDNAEFNGYPQDLFDATYAQVYSQFEMLADMFGITVEELYESYDMSEDDLKDEAIDQVNSYLFLSAVAKAEGIEVTDREIEEFAEETAVSYGYDSPQAMLDESDADELKLAALNRKVSYFILGLSNVTETAYEASEEDMIYDDSSAVDDWEDWEDDEYYEDEDYDEYYDEDYDEYDGGETYVDYGAEDDAWEDDEITG